MASNPQVTAELEQEKRLASRHRSERRFRLLGLASLGIAALALILLLGSMITRAWPALWQHHVILSVSLDETKLGITAPVTEESLRLARLDIAVREAIQAVFPDVQDPTDIRRLRGLISRGAEIEIRHELLKHPDWLGQARALSLPLSDNADMFLKGRISSSTPESMRRLKNKEINWLETLASRRLIESHFNTAFFTSPDSRRPELAGIQGSLVGSFWLVLICLLTAFPLAVMAALYLEEFPGQSRFADWLEITINNLAAVPSIIYGLLGLSLYLHWMELPRSSALAGGLTLALLTLPVIIISTRTALRSVPVSIRDAARALGASPVQVVLHHVLPLALPGIMTGTILGMARAIGETAPLLMIGMVAFIAGTPTSPLDPATAMPVQIFLWSDSPELAFADKTCLLILALLGILIVMNAIASTIRRRFETKW
ncbi:phosphate ABC transporter permease PstA [bacterium]|nr:phosphate ABC transporter permease PstA [bacterium]